MGPSVYKYTADRHARQIQALQVRQNKKKGLMNSDMKQQKKKSKSLTWWQRRAFWKAGWRSRYSPQARSICCTTSPTPDSRKTHIDKLVLHQLLEELWGAVNTHKFRPLVVSTSAPYLQQVEVSVELRALSVFQSLELSGDEQEYVLETRQENTFEFVVGYFSCQFCWVLKKIKKFNSKKHQIEWDKAVVTGLANVSRSLNVYIKHRPPLFFKPSYLSSPLLWGKC